MSDSTLKGHAEQAILAEMSGFVNAVETFAGTIMRGGSPREAEETFRNRVLTMGGRVMGRMLSRVDEDLVEQVRRRGHRDPHGELCSGSLKLKGKKKITFSSLLQDVGVERSTVVCRRCSRWIGITEEVLGVVNGMTAGAASVVSLAAALLPFEQAQKALAAMASLQVDDNRIHRTANSLSPQAESLILAHARQAKTASPPSGATVYVLMDGGRIRMRDTLWHEPCAGLVMWEEGERWVKYGISDPLCKEPVLTVLEEWMERLKQRTDCTVVILGDGAPWIWEWAKQYPWAHHILDYYHLKTHVWEAARALYGESPKSAIWVEDIMNQLFRGWVSRAIDTINGMKPRDDIRGEKKAALNKLVTYLKNHVGLIKYSRHKKAGRRIGSGAIESFCKQLFTMRMKGPGMFWGEDGARAVMHLRTLYLTDKWDTLWNQPWKQSA